MTTATMKISEMPRVETHFSSSTPTITATAIVQHGDDSLRASSAPFDQSGFRVPAMR